MKWTLFVVSKLSSKTAKTLTFTNIYTHIIRYLTLLYAALHATRRFSTLLDSN
jgi:hypothetical protein